MFNFFAKSVPEIQPEEVKKAIDENLDFVLLDVRTVGEFSRGKITGSVNLPVDDVPKKIELLVPDKSSLVYVYCLSGSRSVAAVETMLKLGYSNVFNLQHGLLAWRIKGYPVNS
jgi:rhodanese-related sulfurtransferase